MQLNQLKIVDIRPYTTDHGTRVIGCHGDAIYFYKAYMEDDQEFQVLCQYNSVTGVLKEWPKVGVPEDSFFNLCCFDLGSQIIVTKQHIEGHLLVERYDLEDESVLSRDFELPGEIMSIPVVIDERYLITYVEVGDNENCYLCDLEEQTMHQVLDECLVWGLVVEHAGKHPLPTFECRGTKYLCMNPCHMCDYEYEDIYDLVKDGKVDSDKVWQMEAMYMTPLEDFIQAIKDGNEEISLTTLSKRHIDGWVRYLGIDDDFLYYREKDFDTQIESVKALDLLDLDVVEVTQIDHRTLEGELYYKTPHILEEIKEDNKLRVVGRFGVEGEMVSEDFKGITDVIANRYMISDWWIDDDIHDTTKWFTTIIDLQTKSSKTYEAYNVIFGSTVILYNT